MATVGQLLGLPQYDEKGLHHLLLVGRRGTTLDTGSFGYPWERQNDESQLEPGGLPRACGLDSLGAREGNRGVHWHARGHRRKRGGRVASWVAEGVRLCLCQ